MKNLYNINDVVSINKIINGKEPESFTSVILNSFFNTNVDKWFYLLDGVDYWVEESEIIL